MKLGIRVAFDPSFTSRQERQLGRFVETVMEDYSDIAASYTPVKTGAARAAWHTQGSGRSTEAVNTKPYIQRLDDNWSKQTRGRGILKPTTKQIRRKYR